MLHTGNLYCAIMFGFTDAVTFDLKSFILKDEKVCNKQSIHYTQGQFLSVIYDGTSHSGEALAILVRFVNNSWILEQRLLAIQLLSKSLTGACT